MKLNKLRKIKSVSALLERRGSSRRRAPPSLEGFDLTEFSTFMARMDPDWGQPGGAGTGLIHRI